MGRIVVQGSILSDYDFHDWEDMKISVIRRNGNTQDINIRNELESMLDDESNKFEIVFADRSFLISELTITIDHNDRILEIGEVSLYEYEPENLVLSGNAIAQCSSVDATSSCDNANDGYIMENWDTQTEFAIYGTSMGRSAAGDPAWFRYTWVCYQSIFVNL